MSKAVRFSEYGGPEVLELVEVDDASPGQGKVRVRVKTAGVNPADIKVRSGRMEGFPTHFPQGLGNDFAGVIEEIGDGVTALAAGDEVLGFTAFRAYAEYVTVPERQVTHKPEALSWDVAGSLSVAGQTAREGLDRLGVGKDDTLLVHAAAGGVGGVLVQLAAREGATVVGTASERNHDYLRDLGAIPVSYGPGLVERVRAAAPGGVDKVFDAAGGDAVNASLELVRDAGDILTIADMAAPERYGVETFSMSPNADRLAELADLAASGALRVPVWKAVPLADVREAHEASERGHLRGKIVLTVS
ncbi:MAG: NADP-dependent oxidoreductase [Streptosporangiales bacterium]